MEPALLFALIGLLGVGSQWIAWRLNLPAIVVMLAAGLIAGPVTGILHPEEAFGEFFSPIVSVAVAVILFEGGLTLNLRELRETNLAVRRLVVVGAPLGWLFSTLAAHYGAGLSWPSALVFGGILVVTGPTVVIPLLRQARLSSRPASVLRWEAIVNDPVGALFAVIAFEIIAVVIGNEGAGKAVWHLVYGIGLAMVAGYVGGKAIAFAFKRGLAPEYLKVPILFAAVLAVYASTDNVLHESGLLAVTVMGMVLANTHLPSLGELQRFKENITVLLVSGVFILLAASLSWDMLGLLTWRSALFVLLIIIVARPLAVFLSTIGTELTLPERGIVAWIGPRGVVAVAVSGLFGARLVELGVEDGALLAPLAFVLVAATVIVHGFSIVPVSRWLGLTSSKPPGTLIVGASAWSVSLAEALKRADQPVVIADRNWFRLRAARAAGIPTFHGEVLSENAEHRLGMNQYGNLLALTDNDDYNALICTDFGPEFGRDKVFQVGRHEAEGDERTIPVTLGGRMIGTGRSFEEVSRLFAEGWRFSITPLTEEYGLEQYLQTRPDASVVGVLRPERGMQYLQSENVPKVGPGDALLSFGPKAKEQAPADAP
ncbi:cation:proton antiporter [Oceanomicrobium pacificus]|uniref:Sodium:proton antiporter n=1 Tax=Oceanomicrobium pacificus TaxID=2692916 RepID=A0A6B0TXT9_9RHOB|nr:sodium:proton antiporter [Oceanomicrobium pacificus]MXU66525.1 sodium:proton antiporter [Oceanomicrobium pacificus]